MLNKLILTAALALLPMFMQANMAKWLVYPEYESIDFLDNGLIEFSDGRKFGLMKSTGDVVVKMEYDKISDFNENIALLYNDNKFVGFTDRTGKIVNVADRGYKVTYPELGFSEGYLVVEREGEFYYINDSGEEVYGPFAKAYPFFDGFASVIDYSNPKKKLESQYPCLIGAGGGYFVTFPKLNPDDVNFISSFHDGKAIAVVKKKFYEINASDVTTLVPIEITGVKKPVPVELKSKELDIAPTNFGFTLTAKNAMYNFDKYMRLIAYRIEGQEMVNIEYPKKAQRNFTSNFSKFTDDEKWGLKYYEEEVLPPQLDQVRAMRGDLAIVSINGKYGIIVVDRDANFSFRLNNNENIGFAHKSFDSKVSVRMPTFIKSSSASFDSLSPDCEIYKETRRDNDTMEGNYITYDCRLTIPSDLQNELSTHDYKFAVKYDGLISPEYDLSVKEWYVKLYEVEMPVQEFTITEDGSIDVEFEITEKAENSGNYYREVAVIPMNPLSDVTLKRISENHYIVNIKYLDVETLPFVITITESECPTIRYPFEAVFTKPAGKGKKISVNINQVH